MDKGNDHNGKQEQSSTDLVKLLSFELGHDAGHEEVRGPAVSSFNYGACLDEEGCSVVAEYYKHSGDAKSRNLKLALGKAFLLTAPVAWALLATQSLN